MSKFVLTASKPSSPKADQLQFHATMSLEQFVEAGYCAKGTFGVSVNPKGNKHPKGFFIHWKDSEGVNFSGAVSTKITSPEEITDPVLSIVSTPDKDDMFVLFHNKVELEDNSIFNF